MNAFSCIFGILMCFTIGQANAGGSCAAPTPVGTGCDQLYANGPSCLCGLSCETHIPPTCCCDYEAVCTPPNYAGPSTPFTCSPTANPTINPTTSNPTANPTAATPTNATSSAGAAFVSYGLPVLITSLLLALGVFLYLKHRSMRKRASVFQMPKNDEREASNSPVTTLNGRPYSPSSNAAFVIEKESFTTPAKHSDSNHISIRQPDKRKKNNLGVDLKNWNGKGIKIVEIAEDMSAYQCGMRIGDIIQAVDGKRVINYEIFKKQMRFNKHQIKVRRGEEDLLFTLFLE